MLKPNNLEEAMELLILEFQIDERAAQTLREAEPEVQRMVVNRGGLTGATNNSSALVGRIRQAKNQLEMKRNSGGGLGGGLQPSLRFGAMGRPAPGVAPLQPGVPVLQPAVPVLKPVMTISPEDVERYLQHWNIEPDAADMLRYQPEDVQWAAINQGWSLEKFSNPSAGLVGKIKMALINKQKTEPVQTPPPKKTPQRTHSDALAQTVETEDDSHLTVTERVERYIANNGIDERAAKILREEPPSNQEAVLRQGPTKNTGNPSAVLLSRIKAVRAEMQEMQMSTNGFGMPIPAVPLTPESAYWKSHVDEFIRVSGIDEGAGSLLRRCDEEIQRIVIDRGPITSNKPSALVVARIKHAKESIKQQLGPMTEDQIAMAIEDFINKWCIDARAAHTLRTLSAEAQRMVLEKGGFEGCSNPSSALISRMKAARVVGLEAVQSGMKRDNFPNPLPPSQRRRT